MSERFFKRTKHDESEVRQIFGKNSDARLAAELFRTNRALYDSMRADAEARGLIGPVREHQWAPAHRAQLEKLEREQGRGLTAEQVEAVRQFPREECVRLLKKKGSEPGTSLSDLAKNPDDYKVFKLAVSAHGLDTDARVEVRDHRPKYEPKPEPPKDERWHISDAICREAGLPLGTKAKDFAEYSEITIASAERQLAAIQLKHQVAAVSDAPAPPATENNGESK